MVKSVLNNYKDQIILGKILKIMVPLQIRIFKFNFV